MKQNAQPVEPLKEKTAVVCYERCITQLVSALEASEQTCLNAGGEICGGIQCY